MAEPIEPTLFYKNVLKGALLAAGLPASAPTRGDEPAEMGVRLHDLRHTFATRRNSIVLMAPVLTAAIIMVGLVIALAIALHKTNSKDKAEIIRALADLFRAWFRRGGPPGGPA